MLKLPSRSPVQSLSARCHGEVGWDWKLCPSVCQHFWACQLPPAGRWRGHRTPLRGLILSLKRLELPLESLWDRSFIYPCIDSAALYGVSLWTSRGAVLCKYKGDCGWGHTPSGRSLPPCSVTASLYCAVPQPHSHVRVRFSSNLYNCSFRISLGCLLVSVLWISFPLCVSSTQCRTWGKEGAHPGRVSLMESLLRPLRMSVCPVFLFF